MMIAMKGLLMINCNMKYSLRIAIFEYIDVSLKSKKRNK